MSKIENSMLKGWEFIIDAVALLYDVRTYQISRWNRAHKIL